MAYCSKCGNEISQFVANCPECGKPQNNGSSSNQPQRSYQPDNGGFGWGLLGFCVPIAGLILFLIWKDERPKTAKATGLGALISVISAVLFYIIYIIFIVIMVSSGAMY